MMEIIMFSFSRVLLCTVWSASIIPTVVTYSAYSVETIPTTSTTNNLPQSSSQYAVFSFRPKVTRNFIYDGVLDIVRSIPRGVKIISSSTLESVLLQCTMPTNLAIEDEKLLKLLSQVTQYDQLSKRYGIDAYGIIIRKLVSKMKESDWRISAKAFYILHSVMEQLSGKQRHEFIEQMAGPLEEVRGLITNRLRKRSARVLEGDAGWTLVLSLLTHLDTANAFMRSDRHYLNSLLQQGPSHLLNFMREHLETSNKLILFSREMAKRDPSSAFAKQLCLKCHNVVSSDLAFILSSVGCLKEPSMGDYIAMEQSTVDELQSLARVVRSLLGQTLGLLRLESSRPNRSSASNHTNLSTMLSTAMPPLPAWIHDLALMKTSVTQGPLRLRGGSSWRICSRKNLLNRLLKMTNCS